MQTIYTMQIGAKDLIALSKIAKAVNDDITLGLDAEAEKMQDRFRFWAKDEQKKCALVGSIDVDDEDASGAINVRLPTSNLFDLVGSFGAKEILEVKVVQDDAEEDEPLSMHFTDVKTGETRSLTVQEAAEEDQPYPGKVKGASCTVPAALVHKVIAAYKKNADVVVVHITETGLQVQYTSRNGKDSWFYATEADGEASGKFSTALLAAACTASKNAGKQVTLTQSQKAIRMNSGTDTLRCRVYVAANEAI